MVRSSFCHNTSERPSPSKSPVPSMCQLVGTLGRKWPVGVLPLNDQVATEPSVLRQSSSSEPLWSKSPNAPSLDCEPTEKCPTTIFEEDWSSSPATWLFLAESGSSSLTADTSAVNGMMTGCLLSS